jgi:hypothetical protein
MGLALLIVCGVANASTKATHGNLTKEEVIDTYLNAVVHGKLTGIESAIDDDAQFNMTRGENVNTLSKKQMLAALKASENIEQDCKCTNKIVQDDDDTVIRKVEMKYGDFTRTDVITAQRSGNNWKITKVETSYN